MHTDVAVLQLRDGSWQTCLCSNRVVLYHSCRLQWQLILRITCCPPTLAPITAVEVRVKHVQHASALVKREFYIYNS
jgi:hypothetical protein